MEYSVAKGAIKDEKAGRQRHRHDPPPAPSLCLLHGIENITVAVQKRMQERMTQLGADEGWILRIVSFRFVGEVPS